MGAHPDAHLRRRRHARHLARGAHHQGERPEGHRGAIGMHAEQAAPRASADQQGDQGRRTHRARALRRRPRHLHRRSFVHPPLRLPLAHRRAESRSAAHRTGDEGDQLVRRLRAVRRGRARRGAVPVVLSRLDRQQSFSLGPLQGAHTLRRDRLPAAADRAAPVRRDMNAPFPQRQRPITIAILAMGGEGGGVLADWIIDLAESNHYIAQLTSVPGVAQRTGATIYYLEIYPRAGITDAAHEPVLALMPVPGDVDIVVASELMEAGRAIQRGLITPDRTTLIASTNRVFAMTEKIAMADGRVDPGKLLEACRSAAKTMHAFDMAAIAEATGSVISAVLFGAVAGAGVLPFPRQAFEGAIRRGGKGVQASLAAFTAGLEATTS